MLQSTIFLFLLLYEDLNFFIILLQQFLSFNLQFLIHNQVLLRQ